MATEPNQGATGHTPPSEASTAPPRGESPLTVGSQQDAFAERPELYVGGAFLGGLLLAQILRRLGSE